MSRWYRDRQVGGAYKSRPRARSAVTSQGPQDCPALGVGSIQWQELFEMTRKKEVHISFVLRELLLYKTSRTSKSK